VVKIARRGHPHPPEWIKFKIMAMVSPGEDMEQLELSSTTAGSVKCGTTLRGDPQFLIN
jgi:hypothetical protein